nr:14-3-3 protein 9 [Tanacetum cinerariifolium]GEV75021.1 14-3-3 protein 9 [Tanacetum cinerariifolium]
MERDYKFTNCSIPPWHTGDEHASTRRPSSFPNMGWLKYDMKYAIRFPELVENGSSCQRSQPDNGVLRMWTTDIPEEGEDQKMEITKSGAEDAKALGAPLSHICDTSISRDAVANEMRCSQ